jgi:glycosyltransferase involved in cell wall biosynthesis
MPAYNEANCIARSIDEVTELLERVWDNYEIIIVDDGSTDQTRKIAESSVETGRLKVVGYSRNQGKGHALKIGLHNATGEFALFMDSDCEIRPRELMDYLRALESADMVIGSKRHPLSLVRTPTMRTFLSLGFNLLERKLTGVSARDTQAGFKVARSAALYRILPLLSVKRYAFDAELLTVASLLHYRIRELPVQIEIGARFNVRQVFRMMIDLLGIAYRLRVRRWYQMNILRMSNTYRAIISW